VLLCRLQTTVQVTARVGKLPYNASYRRSNTHPDVVKQLDTGEVISRLVDSNNLQSRYLPYSKKQNKQHVMIFIRVKRNQSYICTCVFTYCFSNFTSYLGQGQRDTCDATCVGCLRYCVTLRSVQNALVD